MFILTREINEYYQEGGYFIASFLYKPTHRELGNYLPRDDKDLAEHVWNGGGRRSIESEWYNLFEFKENTNGE